MTTKKLSRSELMKSFDPHKNGEDEKENKREEEKSLKEGKEHESEEMDYSYSDSAPYYSEKQIDTSITDILQKIRQDQDDRKTSEEESNRVTKLNNLLYLGNRLEQANYANYDLVINCNYPQNGVQHGEIKHVKLNNKKETIVLAVGMLDSEDENLLKFLNPLIYHMNYYISKKKKVLVHCYAGISRSVSVVIAFISQLQKNISRNDILRRIYTLRPIVNPNRGFRKQLEMA
jgi:protein-tyrosine phosphatase